MQSCILVCLVFVLGLVSSETVDGEAVEYQCDPTWVTDIGDWSCTIDDDDFALWNSHPMFTDCPENPPYTLEEVATSLVFQRRCLSVFIFVCLFACVCVCVCLIFLGFFFFFLQF